MASVLLISGISAILGPVNFIGGNFLVETLTGKKLDLEQIRHDKANEKMDKDYNSWKERMEKIHQWNEEEKREGNASLKFRNTDQNCKKYYEAHPEEEILKEANFKNYYKPSKEQIKGSIQ